MMDAKDGDFEGLQWVVASIFSIEPRWTREPDLDSIRETVRAALGCKQGIQDVSFLSQGAFNKLYEVQTGADESVILRVTLPVDPRFKTLSEVATLEWIASNTRMPVPRPICHDASRENPIGFEWILMSKLPGNPWAELWRSLPYRSKEQVVESLCQFSSQIFRNKFRGIGNIYPSTQPSDVGRMVSVHFFWQDRIHENVARGPFRNTRDWFVARLSVNELECRSKISKYSAKDNMNSDDEGDLDDAERTLKIIQKLRPLVDQTFPDDNNPQPEPSVLFHDDLSFHNILVDGEGKLTGVVDWECVSALPLWKACYFPSFLESKSRLQKPDTAKYGVEKTGEMNDLYWEHMMEYELTMLRGKFLDEMSRLEPEWVDIFKSSTPKRDLDVAVQNCDNELLARMILGWVEDVATGLNGKFTLVERIYGEHLRSLQR